MWRRWIFAGVVSAVGLIVAAATVTGFRLTGSVAQDAVAIAVMAVVVVGVRVIAPIPFYRAVQRRYAVLVQRLGEDDDDDWGDHFWWPPRSIRRMWTLMLVQFVVNGALWVAAIAAGAALAPNVDLPWFWPTAITALVTAVSRRAAGWPWRWLAGPKRLPRLIANLLELVPVGLALWLATLIVPGVTLTDGAVWLQALTLVVLALVFGSVRVRISFPFVTFLANLVLAGLTVWGTAWASTWLDVQLRMDGFWSVVLAALLLVFFTFPIRALAG